MMIPITRKEKYINEIVGGGDTAPKTPQTREEFFFAEILGEVIAPSPVTRVEKYLSAIAGQYSGDLPTPTTRTEYFLAKAAGMEIETPIPITREEMLWDTYIPIKTIEGIPPLTFKAKKAGTLKNYRIYGNTVDGESVGDRTGNLFDESATSIVNGYIDNAYINNLGGVVSESSYAISEYIFIPEGANTISMNVPTILYNPAICFYGNDKTYISGAKYNYRSVVTESIPIGAKYLRFTIVKQYAHTIMLNSGSTALPYEPYGYKVPVTVSNGTDTQTTTIYLDAPLEKSGNNADYIDYETQKRHNSDGTNEDVTLPEITVTAGMNTLTAGTEVQPSNVYIKYEGAR